MYNKIKKSKWTNTFWLYMLVGLSGWILKYMYMHVCCSCLHKSIIMKRPQDPGYVKEIPFMFTTIKEFPCPNQDVVFLYFEL